LGNVAMGGKTQQACEQGLEKTQSPNQLRVSLTAGKAWDEIHICSQ